MKNIISTIAISVLLLNFVSNAQDITNTLAPNGEFKIKDGTIDYLRLNQSTGDLRIFRNFEMNGAETDSTTTVIRINGQRFMHNYKGIGTDGYNTFLGLNAGNFTMGGSGIEGSYNTGVGYGTLSSNSTSFSNSAFGSFSLGSNSTGSYNSSFGGFSLRLNSTGNSNSAFGSFSLTTNSTGFSNSAFGVNSLYWNTEGFQNSAFGVNSLHNNTTGDWNSAFGTDALYTNSTAYSNSAFGFSSLYRNTEGFQNSAFGVNSLYDNTTGFSNSAFGVNSLLRNTTGAANSTFGVNSLGRNTTGNANSAFGFTSLFGNTTGYENSAFGYYSLSFNTTGWHNTAFGFEALRNNIAGFQNTAVGHHSLQNNNGNYNTAVGYNAGSTITTGYNLTLVGIDANPSSPIANDQITLGNIFVSSLRCNVQTITSLSDARDKKNITDLTLGLEFITKLKPRQFNWDKRDWYEDNKSDGSKMKEEPTAGFIAQEFDEIQRSENAEWLNLVLKDNPEKWEATYGNLLPVMVKAIQELSIKNEELKIKNEQLEEHLVKFEEMQAMLVKKIEQIESNEQLFKVQIVNSENNNP